jgi:protoheme IX farnesyltransferase
VAASEALATGIVISVLSVVLMALAGGALAAGLLAFTIFFYAVIYSMWLKRATPQNIVIGGAAGAFPPVVGWAVATGTAPVEAWLMFALIFMWTPPHFWCLALFVRTDYGDAGVPMLTETHGRRVTRNQILGYTLALIPVALAPAFTSIGGPVYLVTALVLNALFVVRIWAVWRRDEDAAEADRFLAERRAFKLSLTYLFAHFGALLVEAALRAGGMGGWAMVGL